MRTTGECREAETAKQRRDGLCVNTIRTLSMDFPAKHYVLVDDKLRILTAVKNTSGSRVTTVFPRQGHYALDPQALSKYPSADLTIERIGDLLEIDVGILLAASRNAA